MLGKPSGRSCLMRLLPEYAVGAEVARHWLEQIVRTVFGDRFIRLLRIEAGAAKIIVGASGRHLIGLDGHDGRHAYEDFPAVVM